MLLPDCTADFPLSASPWFLMSYYNFDIVFFFCVCEPETEVANNYPLTATL